MRIWFAKIFNMKRFLQNITLLIFSIVLTVVACEVGIRILSPQNMYGDKHYKPSEYLIHETIPNRQFEYSEFNTLVKFNSHGFRDYEYSIKKPKGTYRIGIIGDSFVASYEVNLDQNFVKILERKLNAKGPINYEVMNFGMNGYGTDQMYIALTKKNINKFKPDLVIYLFCNNDVRDLKVNNLVRLQSDGKLQFIPYEPNLLIRGVKRILRESHLFYFLRVRFDRLPKISRYVNTVNKALDLKYLQHNEKLRGKLDSRSLVRMEVAIHLKEYSDDTKYYFRILGKLVKKMKQLTESWGGKFMVIAGTRDYQLRDKALLDLLDKYGLTLDDIDINKPSAMLMEICRRENIDFLNLLDGIKSYKLKEKIHLEGNAHWSPLGHEKVADTIYDYLVREKYVHH